MVGAVDRGRESFGRQAWGDAWSQLSAADHDAPLELEDLERLAAAAFLVGRDEESVEVWTRAHHVCIRLEDVPRAARVHVVRSTRGHTRSTKSLIRWSTCTGSRVWGPCPLPSSSTSD